MSHPVSFSVEGGLGTDSLLSLQVKSSLHLIPDHLSLLKLCPLEAEEGRGRLPERSPVLASLRKLPGVYISAVDYYSF